MGYVGRLSAGALPRLLGTRAGFGAEWLRTLPGLNRHLLGADAGFGAIRIRTLLARLAALSLPLCGDSDDRIPTIHRALQGGPVFFQRGRRRAAARACGHVAGKVYPAVGAAHGVVANPAHSGIRHGAVAGIRRYDKLSGAGAVFTLSELGDVLRA
jgi:hypothetical protein